MTIIEHFNTLPDGYRGLEYKSFMSYHERFSEYLSSVKIFNATAAAILELVKERVPEIQSTESLPQESRMIGIISGKNDAIRHFLTTIENLKNELK